MGVSGDIHIYNIKNGHNLHDSGVYLTCLENKRSKHVWCIHISFKFLSKKLFMYFLFATHYLEVKCWLGNICRVYYEHLRQGLYQLRPRPRFATDTHMFTGTVAVRTDTMKQLLWQNILAYVDIDFTGTVQEARHIWMVSNISPAARGCHHTLLIYHCWCTLWPSCYHQGSTDLILDLMQHVRFFVLLRKSTFRIFYRFPEKCCSQPFSELWTCQVFWLIWIISSTISTIPSPLITLPPLRISSLVILKSSFLPIL